MNQISTLNLYMPKQKLKADTLEYALKMSTVILPCYKCPHRLTIYIPSMHSSDCLNLRLWKMIIHIWLYYLRTFCRIHIHFAASHYCSWLPRHISNVIFVLLHIFAMIYLKLKRKSLENIRARTKLLKFSIFVTNEFTGWLIWHILWRLL